MIESLLEAPLDQPHSAVISNWLNSQLAPDTPTQQLQASIRRLLGSLEGHCDAICASMLTAPIFTTLNNAGTYENGPGTSITRATESPVKEKGDLVVAEFDNLAERASELSHTTTALLSDLSHLESQVRLMISESHSFSYPTNT